MRERKKCSKINEQYHNFTPLRYNENQSQNQNEHSNVVNRYYRFLNAMNPNGQFTFEWRHKWRSLITARTLVSKHNAFFNKRTIRDTIGRALTETNIWRQWSPNELNIILKHIKAQSINWINHSACWNVAFQHAIFIIILMLWRGVLLLVFCHRFIITIGCSFGVYLSAPSLSTLLSLIARSLRLIYCRNPISWFFSLLLNAMTERDEEILKSDLVNRPLNAWHIVITKFIGLCFS